LFLQIIIVPKSANKITFRFDSSVNLGDSGYYRHK